MEFDEKICTNTSVLKTLKQREIKKNIRLKTNMTNSAELSKLHAPQAGLSGNPLHVRP